MPNAYQVYQRVLQAGRAFLNWPEADDSQIASSLLELDEARFKIFTHQVGMNSTKHLRYTVLALARVEPPVGPLLRELLAVGASFVGVLLASAIDNAPGPGGLGQSAGLDISCR